MHLETAQEKALRALDALVEFLQDVHAGCFVAAHLDWKIFTLTLETL